MSLAAPFPYFGGKRRAAPIVWGLLGVGWTKHLTETDLFELFGEEAS